MGFERTHLGDDVAVRLEGEAWGGGLVGGEGGFCEDFALGTLLAGF